MGQTIGKEMLSNSKLIESVDRIEPCHLEHIPSRIADTIAELTKASEGLQTKLHPKTAASLANLVRVMNCYYSNLIEGHNTRPRDIERALNKVLDDNEDRRNLQLEAIAHIRVQQQLDQQFAQGALSNPASVTFIKWLHKQFYHEAPESMLRITSGSRNITMVPGEFRTLAEHDVDVGRHMPPSSDRVEDFMNYFERRYNFAQLGTAERIIAIAAAHHRLNYIHPFPDGNGRVSRLMSHAMALSAGIGAHGLWSISRGLARGIESRGEYKQMMDHADSPRMNDYDGRGNLSLRALTEFVQWFLSVALDQIRFMSDMFDIDNLSPRLREYVQKNLHLKLDAARIVEEVLHRGVLDRGTAARITSVSERTARKFVSVLVNDGILQSETQKGPLMLHFPTHAVETLFPMLYPKA